VLFNRISLPPVPQPACLVLSRQPPLTLDRGQFSAASGVTRGASALADRAGQTFLSGMDTAGNPNHSQLENVAVVSPT